ncbi:choice-of-anchor A family protein [Myxococcus landrumensis]|uniref:Choice-of-anchor A family protein n=1 Tax=Myxococcus landrumensis TaxID=2813577 RepID=A0ABX7N7F6_9BACT|nr:choice-of-anchor A family protein [Myxococcus landrumus]QSQ13474.1 choice-of-anchor A family protein [Myxococcus landrumus]
MQTRKVSLLPLVIALALACGDVSPHEPQPPPPKNEVFRDMSAERARFKNIRLEPTVSGALLATPAEVAAALDLTSLVSGQVTSPVPQAAVVVPRFGDISPRKGPSMLVLSTGHVDDAVRLPEPGTDFNPVGADGDVATVRVTFNVPRGMTRLSFDYRFLSAESPDFIGSQYNDQFTAHVTDNQGTRLAEQTSVNSAHFFDASATRAGKTKFDSLLADDPSGIDNFPANYPEGIQLFPDAGITDFKSVNVPISVPAQGGQVTLVFEIRDLGDGILDSTVVIDNVAFASLEMIDPNPVLIDTFLNQVETDTLRLSSLGTPARSVAADGVSAVLLRARVSNLGNMTFSLGPTNNPANGGLVPIGSVAAPTNTIITRVEEVATGQFFAFALYIPPEDFKRPGNGDDDMARQRDVVLDTSYTPTGGTAFPDTHTITVVRPPVVTVHDIWSGCDFWGNAGISGSSLHNVTCADYKSTNSESIDSPANSTVVGRAIRTALVKMRGEGTVVTQVDVIGHGMGGLLARKFASRSSYKNANNYGKGDLNRLILSNTPHAGTLLANALTEVRANMKLKYAPEWATLNTELLRAFGFSLEAADGVSPMAIDDLTINNPKLVAIGETQVPTHVLVSGNGQNIERKFGHPALLDAIKMIYTNMETYHPLTEELMAPATHNLIMKANLVRPPAQNIQPSLVFCDQDFDMFATTKDQQGSASATATTSFSMSTAAPTLNHFRTPTNPAYFQRTVELLNTPIASTAFDGLLQTPAAPPPPTCSGVFAPEAPASEQPREALSDGMAMAWEEPLLAGGIRIVSPAPGTPVSPGATVTVVTEGTEGFVPVLAYISGAGRVATMDEPPFTTTFQIPTEAIGTVQLVATGINAQKRMRASTPIFLPVVSSARLGVISVINGDGVLHGVGATLNLTVNGHYDDGIIRDITAQTLGTIYSSSNDGIATVTPAGVVTATGVGIATIVIRNGTVTTSISVTVLEKPVANCVQVRLNDHNLFVLEDYRGGIDVGGKVAAGGTLQLKDFRVGWQLPASDRDNVLVAGQTLDLDNGAVWGEARYGGQYRPTGTVTFPRGSVRQGIPVSFASMGTSLRRLSTDLAALPLQGTTTIESWGGITLRGTDPKVNVFRVEAAAIQNATLLTIAAPANSTVVINVRGTSARFANFGHVFEGGIDENGVLFNLPDATTLTALDYGFYGTVLAPNAHVSFNNGSWVGGMYARSLIGNAVGHLSRLRDTDICR